MALRAYGWIIRKSLGFSRVSSLSVPIENASPFLGMGGCSTRRAGRNGVTGCRVTPVRSIGSDAFLKRLLKSKATETDGGRDHCPASVPPDIGEQISLLVKNPNQPTDPKVLKVAIIGAPNAGKSTLSNQLLGRKVFAVSKKVHTTRSRALGVLTEGDTQIILLDTPGITTPSKVKRHQLERSLLVDPWTTVKEADLVVVMVDVSDKWTCNKLDFEVLKCLSQYPAVPAILVLNKVDLLRSKVRLLELTAELTAGVVNGRKTPVRSAIKPPGADKRPAARAAKTPTPEAEEEGGDEEEADWRLGPGDGGGGARSGLSREQLRALRTQQGWSHFRDVFMLSAVDGEDVGALKRHLVEEAKPGPWQYHSEVLTDQTPEEVCTNIIREKLLEYLPKEVPYTVTQAINLWEDRDNGELDIAVKLYVTKESQMKMVIGQAGHMVARIAKEAGEDLSNVFLREVRLRLSVKMKN